MADNSTTNHPSLPSDYVSINDLRDRWLKQQQQQLKEEENRIEATKRNKGKEKVEEVTTNHPSLPSNYVSILDLRERWLKQQQQKQEENDRIETTRRDKGKEKVQEVTGDCQIDGNSDKNNPHFRKPNPNLIPERGFCRNTKEKAQVSVDCQIDGNADKNSVHFRNPNPNLIREREFRKTPNGCIWRPINKGFNGGEKISTQNQAVQGSNSSQEVSETSDGDEIEAESVVNGGQLMDAPLMNWIEKRKIWYMKMKERERIAKEERENEDAPLMSKDEKKLLRRSIKHKKQRQRQQLAKREAKKMMELNVSKIGTTGETTRETEAKMKEINVSKIAGVGEKTREIEAKTKEINVSKIGGIVERTKESEVKLKEINVSKIGGIAEKTEINVSKIWTVGEKPTETKAKMKDINVSKTEGIEEKTRETKAKMKEMKVTEQCSPGKEKAVLMVAKTVPVWKSDKEVKWGGPRAKVDRSMEVYGRERRLFGEWIKPRWSNCGEVERGVNVG